jgi:hypothetical protein
MCNVVRVPRHEGVWVSGCTDEGFLGLGTSWKRVVRFTPLLLFSPGKAPKVPAGWTSESVWAMWGNEKVYPTGIRTLMRVRRKDIRLTGQNHVNN